MILPSLSTKPLFLHLHCLSTIYFSFQKSALCLLYSFPYIPYPFFTIMNSQNVNLPSVEAPISPNFKNSILCTIIVDEHLEAETPLILRRGRRIQKPRSEGGSEVSATAKPPFKEKKE